MRPARTESSESERQSTVEPLFPGLATAWGVTISQLEAHWAELQECGAFLTQLNGAVRNVPEFSGVHFRHVNDLRIYRCMLYLFTRSIRPETFVETGVLNGFSSAFILLAMQHNGKGTLYSIDIPPDDPRVLAQGSTPLPLGKSPGWVIPQELRKQHCLVLGPAEIFLPQVLVQYKPVDAFLHDSDHCYAHMMFELALAWIHLRPGGWLLCDNVEQNTALHDFLRGVKADGTVIASFDTAERVWKHGLAQKPVSQTVPRMAAYR